MVKKSELKQIPFIDSETLGGRALIMPLTFYDEGEWKTWVKLSAGLKCMKGEPVEGSYFARRPEQETDMFLPFFNFIHQKACRINVLSYIESIRNDIFNLGASLGKLTLFHRSSKDVGIKAERFVSTEVEYIIGVCRSIFDLMQELVKSVWDNIELKDKSMRKRQLPKSFREMALRDERVMTSEEVRTKYYLPIELADAYCRHATFFQVLRSYRDDIYHKGKNIKLIFVTERGFAVDADTQPFASFGVWNEEHMLPNRLASLRPAIAHIILNTLGACEDLAQIIQRIILFPPEIAPGFQLYLRSFHNRELIALEDVRANCLWWEPIQAEPGEALVKENAHGTKDTNAKV